ncbi:flagellar protein FliT [Massilia aerilata]|uniref:Flagellar protein FliT n=1 Tax=Massilia aerilata TaxID=453817 RepID=A0ABW0RUV5_9BURK
MNPMTMCLQLLKADSEAQVIAILERNHLWHDAKAWTDYGNNDNNWSIIGNQQGQAEAALVEKIVNAHDSILMACCRREGLDPAGSRSRVPKSIKEALHRYFKLGKNHLSGISSQERSALAERTCGVVATGAKQGPSYAIFDFGEGQNGGEFFDTFLSLAKSNKLTVPFVQGKFNQGSTGALRFCGEHCIQLILSKRDPSIAGADGQWAFTITRRFEPDEHSRRRSSVIRCLAPGGDVIRFAASSLPVLPTKTSAFGRPMWHGTYVKLYEYNVAPALSTNLQFDMKYRLSALLVEPVFPVRLYERRAYEGHTLETTLNGLELRLTEDGDQNIEPGFPVGSTFTTAAGDFKLRIFALKKDINPRRYTGGDGILFTINGQTHGAFPRTFFQRKHVGMDYLARSLIVVVDCSAISARAVEQIFMPSRDRLVTSNLTKELEEALSELIRDNDALQELRQKRRQEELSAKIGDNKQAQEIFNSIVRKSPVLSKLLITGEKILNPFSSRAGSSEGRQAFEPRYIPSFLELLRPNSAHTPRRVEVGRTARIQLVTDAPNDYLVRAADQGSFVLASTTDHHWHKRVNPFEGIWTLNLSIPEDFPVDCLLTFTCTLGDDTMPEPLSVSFWAQTIPFVPQEAQAGGSSGEKKKNPNQGAGKGRPPPGLALPHIIEVRRQNWADHEFHDYAALRVVGAGDGSYDFYVNMDNLYLINEVQNSNTDKLILENRFKLALVFIGVAILAEPNEGATEVSGATPELTMADKESLVRLISERMAPILLPLVDELSKTGLEEGSSLGGEPM